MEHANTSASLNTAPVAAIRPVISDEDFDSTQGISSLSLTGQVLAGAGVGLLAGAAGYGALKGTAVLVGTEAAIAGEGMAAAGLIGGISMGVAAPFVAAAAAVGVVGYGSYKAIDYLVARRAAKTGRMLRQTTGAVDQAVAA